MRKRYFALALLVAIPPSAGAIARAASFDLQGYRTTTKASRTRTSSMINPESVVLVECHASSVQTAMSSDLPGRKL
ncbi:MAG: hypothetical protein P4K86_08715 [Terracidiphilus sp.]|nr:hypothetical protein [Terracidiphilus sp.]